MRLFNLFPAANDNRGRIARWRLRMPEFDYAEACLSGLSISPLGLDGSFLDLDAPWGMATGRRGFIGWITHRRDYKRFQGCVKALISSANIGGRASESPKLHSPFCKAIKQRLTMPFLPDW